MITNNQYNVLKWMSSRITYSGWYQYSVGNVFLNTALSAMFKGLVRMNQSGCANYIIISVAEQLLCLFNPCNRCKVVILNLNFDVLLAVVSLYEIFLCFICDDVFKEYARRINTVAGRTILLPVEGAHSIFAKRCYLSAFIYILNGLQIEHIVFNLRFIKFLLAF